MANSYPISFRVDEKIVAMYKETHKFRQTGMANIVKAWVFMRDELLESAVNKLTEQDIDNLAETVIVERKFRPTTYATRLGTQEQLKLFGYNQAAKHLEKLSQPEIYAICEFLFYKED